MKKLTGILIVFFAISTNVYTQNFNNPESVAYDKSNDRFIVSNKGGDNISQIDNTWEVSEFYDKCNAPKGLYIRDNMLYVATNSVVLIFDLTADELVRTIEIEGATFLNDITIDNNNQLYVSDMMLNKIFIIDLNNYKYNVFIDTGSNSPNGLYYDEVNNWLYVGYRSTADRTLAIYDMEANEIMAKKFDHSVDGIAFNRKRELFFSNWEPAGVYSISADLKGDITAVSTNHEGPADFKIIQKDGVELLIVPNFLRNTVDFMILGKNNEVQLFSTVD